MPKMRVDESRPRLQQSLSYHKDTTFCLHHQFFYAVLPNSTLFLHAKSTIQPKKEGVLYIATFFFTFNKRNVVYLHHKSEKRNLKNKT